MFTPKKGIVPEQTYRVESHPTVEVLAQWYAKAKKLTGIKHSFIWEIPELSTCFILSIHCHFESEELEWWLHKETVVDKKMLWFYKTEDVSIIYSQILLAVGATHPNEENREDEAEKKKRTKSLGDRFKKSGTGEIPSIFSESESVQTPPPRTGIGIGSTPPPPTRTLDPTPVPVPVPAPVPVPIPDFPPGLLGGDLRVRAVPVLLQTAEKDELTGHLHVHGPKGEIVVQFGLGRAVHAVGLDTKGSEAIMELFTWREGKAHFEEGKQPESASVQESTDEMLRLGEDYLVNLDFIAENSLDEGSILQKPPIELGDDQFERRIQDGAPLGIKVQKSFYDENDGQLSIKEICAKLRLGRSRGLAVAVNMLKLGLLLTPDNRSLKSIVDSLVAPLIAQSESNAPATKVPLQPPKFMFMSPGANASDESANSQFANPQLSGSQASAPAMAKQGFAGVADAPAFVMEAKESVFKPDSIIPLGVPAAPVVFSPSDFQAVTKLISNPQTSIFSASTTLFFLAREFARAFRFGSEFTLLVFCIRLAAADNPGGLNPADLALILGTISKIKREVDILGHLGDQAFGLILPGVNSSQGANLIDRIMVELPQAAPSLAVYQPALHFGMATVPYDATELQVLLQAAQNSMIYASQNNLTKA